MQDGVFLVMDAEQIVWDGFKVGNARQQLRIPIFAGMKLIRELPYIPLDYHPQSKEIMQLILERSAKALQLWQSQFSHLEHRGVGLAEVHNEVQQYPVSTFTHKVMTYIAVVAKKHSLN